MASDRFRRFEADPNPCYKIVFDVPLSGTMTYPVSGAFKVSFNPLQNSFHEKDRNGLTIEVLKMSPGKLNVPVGVNYDFRADKMVIGGTEDTVNISRHGSASNDFRLELYNVSDQNSKLGFGAYIDKFWYGLDESGLENRPIKGGWDLTVSEIRCDTQGSRQQDRFLGNENSNGFFGLAGGDIANGKAGDDLLNGGKGNDILNGGADDDILKGGAGKDVLKGGVGNDVLFGGRGSDDFVFNNAFGDDTIKGFDATDNKEDIDLSAVAAITGFRDLVKNHMEQIGDDVVITVGVYTITLEDVDLANLQKADFIF